VEYTATANDMEKYATYTRDTLTGLDYAVNRYYSSIWGRFLSPDPYAGSARLSNPQSWNRYGYVSGDPVSGNDPSGLYLQAPAGQGIGEFMGCIDDPWDGAWSWLCGAGGGGFPGFVLPAPGGGGGGGGGGTGQPPQVPCGPNNPGAVSLSADQTALLAGTGFSSLSQAQQVVFLTITADAAALGLNLSGYGLDKITIAGTTEEPNGKIDTQTELVLAALNPTSLTGLKDSFGSDFSPAGSDAFHGVYNAGNWRQNTAAWSMQITAAPNGNIQIDIDPFNPNYGLAPFIGHVFGQVLPNWLSGGDTNYQAAANVLARRGVVTFNCP
jgi:RHS repeat-associated protein